MDIREFKDKANKTVAIFKDKLKLVRTGRANPGIVEDIRVEAYGSMTPLNQVASVSVLDASTIGISIWDKGLTDFVVGAINKSELGITPSVDGTLIRLKFPAMTEERRKEISKIVGKYEEEAKISLRSIRALYINDLKRRKDEEKIPENDVKNMESEVEKEMKNFNSQIEEVADDKRKEILNM